MRNLLQTDAFTHRRLLQTDAVTHRRLYTEDLLHATKNYAQKLLHTHFYRQKLLHTDAQIQFFPDNSSRHKKNGNENPLKSLGPKEFSGALFWPRGCSQRLPPYPPLFGKYVFACRRTFVTIPCRTNSLSCDLQNAELLLDQVTIKLGN